MEQWEQNYGLTAFFNKLSGDKTHTQMNDWEVNTGEYKKKKNEITEADFANPNRFLKGMSNSGLAKIAYTGKLLGEAGQEFLTKQKEMADQYRMNPGEAEQFLQRAKERHGLDLSAGNGGGEGDAFFAPRSTVKLMRKIEEKFPGAMGDAHPKFKNLVKADPTKDGYIESGEDRLIFLHELGHAVDFKQRPNAGKQSLAGGLLQKFGPTAGFVGGVSAPISASKEEEGVTTNRLYGGALAGAGVGLGMVGIGNHIQGKSEDNANKEVKRYLGELHGDEAKAQQAFNDSHIPLARNTYRRSAQMNMVKATKNGLGGAALGLGIASLMNKNEDK
jgi:hypothetical protein